MKKPDAIDLNPSMVSDDEEEEFDCYHNSDCKPVHTFPEDEIRLHTSEERITPESGSIKTNKQTHEPNRRSKRLPFAKQTENLGGIPYAPGRNKKIKRPNNTNYALQETSPEDQTEEESPNRIIRKEDDENKIHRIFRISNNKTLLHRIIRTDDQRKPHRGGECHGICQS